MKNYQVQTTQNLVLAKILQKYRKTSTPLRGEWDTAGKLAVRILLELSLGVLLNSFS